MSKKIIVVGGGIAGLSAACRLKGRGYDVTVLESEHEVGGRMRSLKWNDEWWDLGGVQVSEAGVELHAIADELGLTPRRQLYRGGVVDFELWREDKRKAYYFNATNVKGWPFYGAMSLIGKMRMLKLLPELIKQYKINAKNNAHSSDSWLGAWADDESIETWLSRKNWEILEYFFEPWMEKMCSQQPFEISKGALIFLFTKHSGVKTLTWDEGIGLVPRTISKHLNCITNAKVTKVDVTKRPVPVEWTVDGETFNDKADGVIIATQGNMVLQFTQGLDKDRTKFLEGVRYRPYDRAYFRLRHNFLPLGTNYRYFTRKDDPELVMLSQGGMTESASAEGKAFFFGKLRSQAMLRQRQNNYTEDQALDELQEIMARRVPEVVEAIDDRFIWRWDNALACFYPGYLRKLNRFLHELSPIASVDFCGDYLSYTTTDSACVSGLNAASRLHNRMERL